MTSGYLPPVNKMRVDGSMDKNRIFIFTYAIGNIGLILYGTLALANPSVMVDSFSQYVYQFREQIPSLIGVPHQNENRWRAMFSLAQVGRSLIGWGCIARSLWE